MRERVIDAFVADFQGEWFDATTLRQRAFVAVRAYGSFAAIIAGCLVHDARHDVPGFARRIVPVAWGAFCVVWWLHELSRNFQLMSVYTPAIVIWFYRNKRSEHRSWAGCASAILLMAVFLAVSDLFPDFRHILGWAAGACVAASWTFLVKKQPSVVESSH